MAPAPMAIPLRFRLSQRRVADIILIGGWSTQKSWLGLYDDEVSAHKDMTADEESGCHDTQRECLD